MSFYVSTATFFWLHCDEWDRVVALPRHKFVTGATLLQLVRTGMYSILCYRQYFLYCPLEQVCIVFYVTDNILCNRQYFLYCPLEQVCIVFYVTDNIFCIVR